jgi:hypothetical protein
MTRTLATLAAVVVIAGTAASCTAEQVRWYLEDATPEQRAAVDDALRQSAPTDCVTAQRRWFPEANGWGPAIIQRESRNNPGAANARSTARGCWQLLLSLHGHRFHAVGCSPSQWADARCNTLAARHLYMDAGRSPWSA